MAETIGLTMLACVVLAGIVISGWPKRRLGSRSLRARALAWWIRRRR